MRWVAAVFGALAGAMLVFPQAAAGAAQHALSLFAFSIAPVLGPFMVCMLMLSSRIQGNGALQLALAWLCGSPGGGKIMLLAQPQGKTALRFSAVSGTMSPMFFLGAISAWLQSKTAGGMILLCHLAGAAILGLILPRGKKGESTSAQPLSLPGAIRDSALALLSIAICMMLGCVSAKMVACALPRLPDGMGIFLQCALEITAGAERIARLDTPLKLPLLCAACSFGGLSLLMQNAAVWQEASVSMGQLFLLRLLHAVIAFLLCGLLSWFLT